MAQPDVSVFVGLGSNVGERLDHVRAGARGLAATSGVAFVAASPVYETRAHTRGAEEQHDYLNAVIHLRTDLSPEDLLRRCLVLEEEAGRRRTRRWAPRTLDLDLLIYGDVRRADDHLTLPHPRLAERRFVLEPLADLAPDLHVPQPFDDSVAELLYRCPDTDRPRRTPYSLLD